jgi:hypothetical protein
MNFKCSDEDAQIIINALDCLTEHKTDYGYTIRDIPRIANIAMYFINEREKVISNANNPVEDDGPPKDGEQFVYGKGNVRKK